MLYLIYFCILENFLAFKIIKIITSMIPIFNSELYIKSLNLINNVINFLIYFYMLFLILSEFNQKIILKILNLSEFFILTFRFKIIFLNN